MATSHTATITCWRCHVVPVLLFGLPCALCRGILEAEYAVQRAANGGKNLYIPEDWDGPELAQRECQRCHGFFYPGLCATKNAKWCATCRKELALERARAQQRQRFPHRLHQSRLVQREQDLCLDVRHVV